MFSMSVTYMKTSFCILHLQQNYHHHKRYLEPICTRMLIRGSTIPRDAILLLFCVEIPRVVFIKIVVSTLFYKALAEFLQLEAIVLYCLREMTNTLFLRMNSLLDMLKTMVDILIWIKREQMIGVYYLFAVTSYIEMNKF